MQVQGTVTSAVDGAPISEAEIELRAGSSAIGRFYTDAGGRFHVVDASDKLIGATLGCAVSKDGFESTSLQRNVDSGDVALEIELAPVAAETVTIRGSVHNAKTQASIKGVDVTCSVGGKVVARVKTNESGEFIFEDPSGILRGKTIHCAAGRDGFKSNHTSLKVGPGDTFANINLTPEDKQIQLWQVLAVLAVVVGVGVASKQPGTDPGSNARSTDDEDYEPPSSPCDQPDAECAQGQTRSTEACGVCGTRTEVCSSICRWERGPCENEGCGSGEWCNGSVCSESLKRADLGTPRSVDLGQLPPFNHRLGTAKTTGGRYVISSRGAYTGVLDHTITPALREDFAFEISLRATGSTSSTDIWFDLHAEGGIAMHLVLTIERDKTDIYSVYAPAPGQLPEKNRSGRPVVAKQPLPTALQDRFPGSIAVVRRNSRVHLFVDQKHVAGFSSGTYPIDGFRFLAITGRPFRQTVTIDSITAYPTL